MFRSIGITGILLVLIILTCACEPVASRLSPTITNIPSLPSITPTAMTPTEAPPTTTPTLMEMPTATIAPTMAPIQVSPTVTSLPQRSWEKVTTFDLPDSFVNTIAFSSDGQTMITGDRNGEVLLWKCDTWEKTVFLPAQSTYAQDEAVGVWYWGTLALSPDGSMIVNAYGDNGTVTGYDLTGQVMFTYLFGSRVWAVAISPDGRLLAVAGLPNNVVIFDLETRQPIANLVSDYEYIFNLVFSPDSNTLLVAYERPGNVIKLWDTTTWQETSTFTHVSTRIDYHDILFTPDGTELVLATNELGDPIGVRVWDLTNSQIVREFRQNSQAAYQIAFSPDGSLLASVHEALQLWDMKTGAPIKTIHVPNREHGAVAFSPDGTLIAFSIWGEGIQVWSLSPAAVGASLTSPPDSQAMSINSIPITPGNAADAELIRTLKGHNNRLFGLGFSPDGRFFGSYSLDGVVQVWDPATWQVIQEFTDPNATGWRLFFLADNAHISSGTGTVWNITTGEVEHALGRGHRVTFSPDGIWMADNGGQRGIALWRIENWQMEREIVTSHTGDHLAFSSDSRLLASSGPDFAVKLTDVTTGQELFTLQGHQNIIHGLAFSTGGQWLASASMDTTIKVWDVETGQLIHTLQTGGELFDVTFSPDSSLVAAALNNNNVELWDVASGRLVRILKHGGEVVSVAFSPDGTLLACGAYNNKIYLWGVVLAK